MKYVIVSAIIIASLFACKKNKGIDYTVEGVITDQSFSAPAAGVEVSLYQTNLGGEPHIAQTVTTGSDGRYSFTIKRDKIENFKITYTKNNYFSEEKTFTLENLNSEEANVYNIGMNAKAWVKLIFNNLNPDEGISLTRDQGLSGCSECCSYSSLVLNGVTDTNFVCLNVGNNVYSYMWIYLTGGSYTGNSVTTVPLDTTDLVLNF